MAECGYELIESRIHARSTYVLYLRLWIKRYSDALSNFLFCLGDELGIISADKPRWVNLNTDGCKQDMQRIFADRLNFLFVVMPGVGMMMTITTTTSTVHSLHPFLCQSVNSILRDACCPLRRQCCD